MAFLDKSTLIVDAVLTEKGREKLSKNEFIIEKFALADDEIDYALYDEGNTNGPNFYGVALENMPILEAFTKSDMAMKYKLTTLEIGDAFVPELSNLPASVTLTSDPDQAQAVVISPATNKFGNETEEYIFELQSDEFVDLVEGDYVAQQEAQQPTMYPVQILHVDSVKGQPINLNQKQKVSLEGKAIPGVNFDWDQAEAGGYLVTVEYPAPMDISIMAVSATGGLSMITQDTETKIIEGEQAISKPFILQVEGSGQLYFAYSESKSKDGKGGKEDGTTKDEESGFITNQEGMEKGDTK
tara:strand:+ start:184 stop:1080 length:897 start_codon:yes stop_codon:yes gene_type:complete